MMHGDVRGLGMGKQLWNRQGIQTGLPLGVMRKVWFILRVSFSTWEGGIIHTI